MTLEPLYTLKVAAELIPWRNPEALRKWLNRRPHEYPPRYRVMGRIWTRVLPLSECQRIRNATVKIGRYSDLRRWTLHRTPTEKRA